MDNEEVFMATVLHQHSSHSLRYSLTHAKARIWAVPIGRLFFSLLFISSGMNHFGRETIAYGASAGVPMADFLVPVAGIMAIFGGISVLLGYYARFGALVLMAFLIPVTLMMHDFWNFTDPQMHQMQMVNFMKNVSLLGASLLIAFYGAGPVSVDNQRPKRKELI